MRTFTLVVALFVAGAAMADGARLDHLVVGISDLEAGLQAFEALTGVKPTVGGEHPGAGTRNALASLGDGVYLEIIAPVAGASGDSIFGNLGSLDTLTPLTWALSVDDAQATADRLKELGHEVYGPAAGSRVLPNGGILEWQIVALPAAPPQFPFFIRWGDATAHPSTTSASGCSLVRLTVTTPERDSLRELLEPLNFMVTLDPWSPGGIAFTLDCPNGEVDLR